MTLLKEIISNSIEEVIGSYIAYSASDDSARLGKIDKDELAKFVGLTINATNGNMGSLHDLLNLTRDLFPNFIAGEDRITLLMEIKEKLMDKGISLESELLDEENIDDCISYYKDSYEYEEGIFKQLTSNLQEKIIKPLLNSVEISKIPSEVKMFVEGLYSDHLINKLRQMVEFIEIEGSEATEEDFEAGERKERVKISELSESIALGQLSEVHYKMIKESIEDVVASAWTFVKEFNSLKDEEVTDSYQAKLLKSVVNHVATVTEGLSSNENLNVEDILKGLNVLIPLTAMLNSFEKLNVKDEENNGSSFKEAFSGLAEKINAVDLGEKKEAIDGMVGTISDNISKYLRTQDL